MQIPIVPIRGQRKPWGSIPRINWAHPLTRNLVFYGYDMGSGPIDLVTGKLRTIANFAATNGGVKSTNFGTGLLSVSGATSGSAISRMPTSTPITNLTNAAPFSFACALMQTVLNVASNFPVCFSTGDTTTNRPLTLGVGASGTGQLYFGFANSGSTNSTAVGVAGAFTTMLAVALTSATTQCYVNGVADVAPAVTTTLTQATTAPQFQGEGTAGSAQHFMDGYVYYGALWQRILTASEARLLHDDPYCFLIYPEDEMFATLVGAAAAGFTWSQASDEQLLIPKAHLIREMMRHD